MPTMKFALNYSRPAADLLRRGQIAIDYFKCPDWAEDVAAATALAPAFIHFPLRVGPGRGDAVDDERGRPVDWPVLEDLLVRTGTPLVNAHLMVKPADFPDLARDTMDPAALERLAEAAARDLRTLVSRFGAERVIVENVSPSRSMSAILLPAVIRQVIDAAGCGFLFDLSHASPVGSLPGAGRPGLHRTTAAWSHARDPHHRHSVL